jgi:hypothetical protein
MRFSLTRRPQQTMNNRMRQTLWHFRFRIHGLRDGDTVILATPGHVYIRTDNYGGPSPSSLHLGFSLLLYCVMYKRCATVCVRWRKFYVERWYITPVTCLAVFLDRRKGKPAKIWIFINCLRHLLHAHLYWRSRVSFNFSLKFWPHLNLVHVRLLPFQSPTPYAFFAGHQ